MGKLLVVGLMKKFFRKFIVFPYLVGVAAIVSTLVVEQS